MLINLIKNELFKMMINKKLYVFLLVIVLFTLLPAFESLIGQVPFNLNGQNIPMYMLTTHVMVILPLYTIIIVTDMITDEYVSGTLKLPLLHPVSRTMLLTAKISSLFVSLIILLSFAMVFAYLFGTIVWEFGDQLIYEGETFATVAGLGKTLGAYWVSSLPLTAFGAFIMLAALLLSSNGAALGISVGFLIFLNLAGEMFVFLRPYLLVAYFKGLGIELFFNQEFGKALLGIGIILLYGGISYWISIRYFKKKDLQY